MIIQDGAKDGVGTKDKIEGKHYQSIDRQVELTEIYHSKFIVALR